MSTSIESRPVWFERAGSRLFAIDKGHGLPVLFFHGGLADPRASLFHVGGLAAAHRVVMPDLRGSGRSIHAGDLSWDLLADDAAALLDHLGIERAVVGGVSAGSAVALRFALRHPARALGLLLKSPVYAGGDRQLTEAQRAAFRAMEALGRRVLEEGIDVLCPLYERLPEAIREAALEMMRGFDPASVAATTRFLASAVQPFQTLSELGAIAAPALLVPGTDPEHPAEVCALYARYLRRATTADPSSAELLERMEALCESCSEAAARQSRQSPLEYQ